MAKIVYVLIYIYITKNMFCSRHIDIAIIYRLLNFYIYKVTINIFILLATRLIIPAPSFP